jgi:D-alanyl-D-alanine carboxypeptidase
MNFLEIDVVKDKSNTWRNVFVIFLLFLTIGGLTLEKFIISNPNFVGVTQQLKKIEKIVLNSTDQAGGDVEVKLVEVQKPKLPELTGTVRQGGEFTAKAMIVKDTKTGTVLFSKNEYEPRPLASITKLMSALVILDQKPDWTTTTVVIGADSLDAHMYAGDVYTFQDLWYSALVGSSNKAIISMVSSMGFTEEQFVKLMNEKAKLLGMSNTIFSDASGLSAENISTASDVVLLLKEAESKEKISNALMTKEYSLFSNERNESHHMWNTDWVLLGWMPNDLKEFFGGKTGFISASGYNFTMRAGDGASHVVDVVVLGADTHENRFKEAVDITNWVFSNYKWPDQI